jgi:two-component system, response regulator
MERSAQWVLLVEDNEDEASLAKRAFGRTGIESEVVVASDGHEAIEILKGRQDNPPRVAFFDVRLPGMSGLDVLEWMRSQASLRYVPAIVLVGSGDLEMLRRALDMGANSLVRKEVDYDLYIEKIGMAYRYWLSVNLATGASAEVE